MPRTPGQLSLMNVLVPTDFSDGSRWALQRAARLPLDSDAVIHVVHVIADKPFLPRKASDAATAALSGSVDELNEALARAGRQDVSVRQRLETGRPYLGIGSAAKAVGADVIVAGRRGVRGFRDVILGSTADRVIRTAKQPVLLVAAAPKSDYRRVAASVELDEPLAPMLRWALRLGGGESFVGAIHACEVPHRVLMVRGGVSDEDLRALRDEARNEARTRLAEELAKAERELGSDPGTFRPLVRAGDPRRRIPRWAGENAIDLMVVGTHARGAVAHALLGSVAGELLRLLPCDTLVVPSGEPGG